MALNNFSTALFLEKISISLLFYRHLSKHRLTPLLVLATSLLMQYFFA